MIQLAKGKRKTVLSAIEATTTSEPQKANGHNALILFFNIGAGGGKYSVKLQGLSPDGAYIDLYKEDGNQMILSEATADKAQVFTGIPETFRIVATEDVNGSAATIGYELFTI